jgi:cell division protein ZapA
MTQQSVVTLHIAGEDYTIRAHATPEHARACAAHVDSAIREIQHSSSLVQREKAVILAALAITDELFQARAALENVQGGLGERIARLTSEIEARLKPENLAGSQ